VVPQPVYSYRSHAVRAAGLPVGRGRAYRLRSTRNVAQTALADREVIRDEILRVFSVFRLPAWRHKTQLTFIK
jgi:hypothetical protein